MGYPFWHVPGVGSTMLIPAIALPHVLVSHFAVGGGILLWLGIRSAHRQSDVEFLQYLRKLTRFFVLLTVVFGAITGVGIWWTIALSSPEATSTLIHAFVFGWATEWVTFVIELVAAFGLFYFWDRFTPRAHIQVALAYALAAWVSLVLITGITAFMLSTGAWTEHQSFWIGFFNPTLLPSVVGRTGGALAITGLYIMLHVTLIDTPAELRARVVPWAARWALVGIALIAIGSTWWWFFATPEYVRVKLLAAPAVLMITVICIGATGVLTLAVGLGPVTRANWLVPPFAALLFVLGTVGLFTGEFLREAGRKPYTIENYLFSNNVAVADVASVSEQGYVNWHPWVRSYLEQEVPALFVDGEATPAAAAGLPPVLRHRVGEAIYEYQCGPCHTRRGYNALLPRLAAADLETTRQLVQRMAQVSPAMPPFVGQDWEADVLAEFLNDEARGGVR